MAIDINKVANDTSVAPANSEKKSSLPTEILEMPVFAGILQGAPAALWTNTGDKSVEATTAVKNQKALADTGIFLYRDKPSKLDLIFNAQFISKELIDKAAEKGKLKDVASPLAETVASFNGTGAAPEAGGGSLPAGGTPGAGGLPETPINTQRLSNLQPGSPTSGPSPAAGRVINSIQKPVI